MMKLDEDSKRIMEDAKRKACTKCFHFQFCKYAAAVAPLFADSQTTSGQTIPSPIKADSLAEICRGYTPISGVITQ